MSTIPGKTRRLAIVAGMALIAAAFFFLGTERWMPEDRGDVVEEAPAVDSATSGPWPEPANDQSVRSNRPLLRLVGVTASSGMASAIILEKGGDARTYRAGDQVPGNRELIEIHPSYVILRDAEQRLERLRMDSRAPRQQADPEELRQFAEGLVDRPAEAEAESVE